MYTPPRIPSGRVSMSHEQEYRQIWFLFVFAQVSYTAARPQPAVRGDLGCGVQVTYMAAWSSILCYVTSGMVRSADEMPIAVWVSTVGLLTLYQTFVSAQARSVYVRCHACLATERGGELWRGDAFDVLNRYSPTATAVYQLLDSGGWQNIILVAMNISSNLISGVLYSIPAIRKMLHIPNGYNGNETWCILVFVYTSSVLLAAASYGLTAVSGRCDAGSLHLSLRIGLSFVFYASWSVGWFFLWGYCVMRPWLKHDIWVFVAVGESTLLAVLWVCVVFHKRSCAASGAPYLWERARTTVTGGGLLLHALCSVAWFFFWGYFTLRVWLDSRVWMLVALGESVACTLVWVYTAGRPADVALEAYGAVASDVAPTDAPTVAPTDADKRMMASFGNEHCIAAVMHMLVMAATILVTSLDSVDINSHYETYSFWLDRKKSRLAERDDDSPILLDYCVRPNSLPVMKWWCVLGWSFASFCYHTISAIRIKADRPAVRSMLSRNAYYADKLSLVFIVAVSACISFVAMPQAGRENESWTKWMLLAVLCCVGIPVVFVLRGITDVVADEPPTYTSTLQQITKDKWVEYTISATTMHVIVNCVGGIVSSHELILLCGYLAVSMILVQLMEASILRMEHAKPGTRLSVARRIDCERAFVALSFFSKLTLTVALCAPLAISDALAKGSFVLNTEPIRCS